MDALWGVGPVTARKLRAAGIDRLVDVRTADAETLRRAVGSWAESLRQLAFGDDDRAVEPNRERKSIGCEETYAEDIADLDRVRSEVEALARHAAEILHRKKLLARTVTLKLRYATFETITRSATREPPTMSADEIAARALVLLERTDAGRRPVRLLGCSLHGLSAPEGVEPESDAARKQLDLPVDASTSS